MSKKSKNKVPAPTPLPDKYNVDDSKEQTEQANNYKELDRILKEYMECCIIMGYDVKGNGIVRIIHDNHLQNDALHHLLQKVVMSHLGPPGMMGGNSLE